MIFLYIYFILFILFFEIYRSKKVFVDFLLLFNVFFVFQYLLPATIYLINTENYESWRFLSVVPQAGNSLAVFIAILIGYVSIFSGFQLGSRLRLSAYPRLMYKYGERTQFLFIALPFFIITLASLCIYAYGHGGFLELLLGGKEIRAGRQQAGVYQYFTYFASGIVFAMLTFFGFYRLSKHVNLRRLSILFLFLSFFFALIYAFGTAGRGSIGTVFLMLFFFWLNLQSPKFSAKKIAMFLIFGCFVFLLVTYGKSLLWTLDHLRDGPLAFWQAFQEHRAWYVGVSENSHILDRLIAFIRNVDHGIVSVYLAIYSPDIYHSPRLFFDWPRAFFEIIPGISQPDFIVSGTPSSLNRDYLGVEGYVPPGWVAMKVINGGLIWLAFGSFIAGFVGGWVERFLLQNLFASPMMPGLLIIIAYFWKDSIVGPDPFMFVMPNLTLFLLMLLLLPHIILKKRKSLDSL